jgi:ELP3 family radical SAM enzyme/protein acetyltransferase
MYHPEDFIRSPTGKNTDIEDIWKRDDNIVSEKLVAFTRELFEKNPQTSKELQSTISSLRKEYRISPRHSDIIKALTMLDSVDTSQLKYVLTSTKPRSSSGVLVITLVTSPYPEVNGKKQSFSCQWNCYYCPNEPGQPRSYLHDEPAVKRANADNFDPVLQFADRAQALAQKGHPIDKIEIIVLGGTWFSYPKEYRLEFCRDIFFAANTFWTKEKRERKTLSEEQIFNEVANCKIIGLTLETRPDTVNIENIIEMRACGCTRVQLGVQHTNDEILEKINRKCSIFHVKFALQLLKDACFKVDIHLMPNLPGATPEIDRKMFETVLVDSQLQADQWKIYPCEVVPWTVIEKWYKNGTYQPYNIDELTSVLIDVKSKVHPWIRLNRVIRDIPSQYIFNDNIPNMRDDIKKKMHQLGLACKCIRCREIGNQQFNISEFGYKVRKYFSSGSWEYFLSFENEKDTIVAFLRLRIPKVYTFQSMQGMAFVRELHVYGQTTPVSNGAVHVQHSGFGKRLLRNAEFIGILHGCYKMAVISGVGTRGYYRKRGYTTMDENGYMIKHMMIKWFHVLCFVIFFVVVCLFFL